MSDSEVHAFFSTGAQYYVAGRFSAFAGLNPVTGNLLHHAIEMFLKGGLSNTKSLGELKKLDHKLPKVWSEFKRQCGDADLTSFDQVVAELDKFESIRYPDEVLKNGMSSTIDIVRSPQSKGGLVAQVPHYGVCLEEIDELVAAIFQKASRNPKAYLGNMMMPTAQEFLRRDNKMGSLTA